MSVPPEIGRLTRTRAVVDRLGLLLVKLGDEVLARAEPRLAEEAKLTSRQYLALVILEREEPPSQQVLATLMDMAPAQTVALIDELEALGHVERSRDPADRRRTRVVVTASGRQALASGDEATAAVERDVFGAHAAEVLDALQRGLGATNPSATPTASAAHP
jgi:DNA-binding MarR family transcriptional regulator